MWAISVLTSCCPFPLPQMSEPVGDFLRGGGWRGSPRFQPSSPRFGVAAEFGVRSPETLPRTPSLAYCTLQVGAETRQGLDVFEVCCALPCTALFCCGRPKPH